MLVSTTDPRQSFQVGGDPSATGKIGVGINSIGNIRASGIITATSFVGALIGCHRRCDWRFNGSSHW